MDKKDKAALDSDVDKVQQSVKLATVVEVLKSLLGCCELNVDELEPETVEACEQARAVLKSFSPTETPAKPNAPADSSECDNCGAVWQDGEMDEIKHFWERVTPGCIMPSGQCINCGALCYPKGGEAVGDE